MSKAWGKSALFLKVTTPADCRVLLEQALWGYNSAYVSLFKLKLLAVIMYRSFLMKNLNICILAGLLGGSLQIKAAVDDIHGNFNIQLSEVLTDCLLLILPILKLLLYLS
jgi:hypothetical protein